MRRFVKNGGTVVLVAHDLQLISEVADRVIVLNNGTIKLLGNMREILSDTEWLRVQGFTPFQSTLLAGEVGLRGLVKTGEISEALVNTLKA